MPLTSTPDIQCRDRSEHPSHFYNRCGHQKIGSHNDHDEFGRKRDAYKCEGPTHAHVQPTIGQPFSIARWSSMGGKSQERKTCIKTQGFDPFDPSTLSRFSIPPTITYQGATCGNNTLDKSNHQHGSTRFYVTPACKPKQAFCNGVYGH